MLQTTIVHVVPAAYSLLPPAWESPAATAFALAIGLHEGKRFTARRQIPRKPGYLAPARSFYQFEIPGVKQVRQHLASARAIENLLAALRYPKGLSADEVLRAIEHNDILAFGMARGLIRTLPQRLPDQHDPDDAYFQYLEAWKPNREAAAAHRDDWPANYALAWDTVLQHAIDRAVRRKDTDS